MDYLILAVNPGSTSTKIAVLKNNEMVIRETIYHDHSEIEKIPNIVGQIPLRKKVILDTISEKGINVSDLSAVVGCGGLFPPVNVGGYVVNENMLDMILNEKIPPHASNLGAVIAHEIGSPIGKPAYVYDAVSAGVFPDYVKITGFKEIKRRSFSHVLNSRATAIKYAQSIGQKFESLNLIIVHLGGGISAGAYESGTIVDSFADDNGPFAPERSGGAPLLDFIELCYSGEFTKKEMQKKVRGMGGLKALLGTSNGTDVQKMVDSGDKQAILVMKALAYQAAKAATALLPALKCKCDAIILTGGLAYNESFVKDIKEFLGEICKIEVLPGENEMEALAFGCLRILKGEETASVL